MANIRAPIGHKDFTSPAPNEHRILRVGLFQRHYIRQKISLINIYYYQDMRVSPAWDAHNSLLTSNISSIVARWHANSVLPWFMLLECSSEIFRRLQTFDGDNVFCLIDRFGNLASLQISLRVVWSWLGFRSGLASASVIGLVKTDCLAFSICLS